MWGDSSLLQRIKPILDKGFNILAKLQGFHLASVCQKNIWEGSPDKGGDLVATTVEIHAVMNNDYG